MKSEILTIHVLCTQEQRVRGIGGVEVGMILFTGTADHPNFRGEILPGGCDTQVCLGDHVRLSARYMLEGVDCAGERCRIFIENNGRIPLPPVDPVTYTTPKITTDSKALAWMETANLSGTVCGEGAGRVLIRIFTKE